MKPKKFLWPFTKPSALARLNMLETAAVTEKVTAAVKIDG